jgi:hypothetical protein
LPPMLRPPRATPDAMMDPVNLVSALEWKFFYVVRKRALPEAVEDGGDDTSVCRVGNFHNIHGSGSRRNVDTETEQETTTHELLDTLTLGCYTLDDGTNDDAKTSNPHAESSSECIGGGTNEWQRDNTTNLVHGSHDTSPDTSILSVVVAQEILVGEEVIDQWTIVTVHRGAEKSDETSCVKLDGWSSEWLRRLLKHCLVEGLISFDNLDLDFGMFLKVRN